MDFGIWLAIGVFICWVLILYCCYLVDNTSLVMG